MRLWPVNVPAPEITEDTLEEALRSGPYGRCVFACGNDVVDNQVVNMLFENGAAASMTMTAFTPHSGRRTRIFGTLGQVETDSTKFKITHFLDDSVREFDSGINNDGGILTAHGGGDFGLMDAFVRAVSENDPAQIFSGIDETLESHLMVFAAEKARRENSVIQMSSMN